MANSPHNFSQLPWLKTFVDSSIYYARKKCVVGAVKRTRFRYVVAFTLLAVSITVLADDASTSENIHFNIPQQRADRALTRFAEQANLTLIVPYDVVQGKTANRLVGEYPKEEAIELLLTGTGLKPTFRSGPVLSIATDAQSVAEGDEVKDKTKAGLGTILAAVFSMSAQAQEAAEEAGETEIMVDEIIVTGTTIRGVYPDSQPLDIYTAEDIALSGATTVERFLETLPQNLNSGIPTSVVFGPGDGNLSEGRGVDLRGFGPGTTLTLLNGRRLSSPEGNSADVSLIPIGAIERVEVLTDGASAVYGSDAIGGVVNFILRDDFEGVDLAASYGFADGGYDRFQANLAGGMSWGVGAGFISLGHSDQSELDASERDFSSNAESPTFLVPREETNSLLATIEQTITDRVRLFGTLLYSERESEHRSIQSVPFRRRSSSGDQEQLFLTAGIEHKIAEDLFFQLDATYVDYSRFSKAFADFGVAILETENDDEGTSLDLMAKVDGRLLEWSGGEVRFSVGGGYSEQDFEAKNRRLPDADFRRVNQFGRHSYYVFAEGFAPIIGGHQNVSGIERLELSAAVRYTEYSDFEEAVTPRVGLLWSPVSDLNLRGTYSRGFRAPTLRDINPSANSLQIFRLTDLGFPDTFSDDGSTVLGLPTGVKSEGLTAEFSDAFTIGLDYRPDAIPGLEVSATYYLIEYEDRFEIPVNTVLALRNQDEFRFAFDDVPTLVEITSIFDALENPVLDRTGQLADPNNPRAISDLVEVILDARRTNAHRATSEGVDVSATYRQGLGVGEASFGANLTYTLESSQQGSPNLPEVSQLGFIGRPVSLRGRLFAGLSRGGFSGQLNMSYVDSYRDRTVLPEQPVDSWTTFDLNMRYTFGGNRSDLLGNTSLSLTVQNLFDTDPPAVGLADVATQGGLRILIGYDPVNADPLGRFVTLGLTKQF